MSMGSLGGLSIGAELLHEFYISLYCGDEYMRVVFACGYVGTQPIIQDETNFMFDRECIQCLLCV